MERTHKQKEEVLVTQLNRRLREAMKIKRVRRKPRKLPTDP
jgi:hypothetical protein